jgi:hypothetical protein
MATDFTSFILTEGVLKYQGLIYVPRDTRLRERIMRIHLERQALDLRRAINSIRQEYWWPNIIGDMATYAVEQDTPPQPAMGPQRTTEYIDDIVIHND